MFQVPCFRTRSAECFCGNERDWEINGSSKPIGNPAILGIGEFSQKGLIQLNGTLADLGTAGEVYCADPGSDSLEILISGSEPYSPHPHLEFRCSQSEGNSKEYFLRFNQPYRVEEGTARLVYSLFSEPFNYLHAERVGPRKVFPISLQEAKTLACRQIR